MLSAIERYRSGKSGIGKLVSDLEALLACLRDTDQSWKRAFTSQWGKLEDIHAMMLYRNQREVEGVDRETVATVLAELTVLIQSELS
jgi:hypothetical protein